MKRLVFLTSNGNLLTKHGKTISFHKPNGDFLRLVTEDEFEYLSEECTQIELLTTLFEWETPMLWKYLWSSKINDYSRWKAETSNNGGDYSFHTEVKFYARKTRNGWQFVAVSLYSTSAEFSYDELAGRFESDVCVQDVLGTEDLAVVTRCYTTNLVLDQIGKPCGLPFGINDVRYETAEHHPEVCSNVIQIPVTVSKLKERAKRLQEIGFTRPNAHTRRKNKRPQNNRVRR